MVRLYLGNGIVAEGEGQELATFYSCFLTKLKILSDVVKADEENLEAINNLIRQVKVDIKKVEEEE